MRFEARTNIGKKRENNEDYYYVPENDNFPLFVVADGIGGHNSGEIASKMAVEEISSSLKTVENYKDLKSLEDDFLESISKTNDIVYTHSKEDAIYEGMGTTLTIIYILEDTLLIGHVGDSRAYAINNNSITQLTEDDTYVNKLVKLGEITKEEAINHPKRNIITNAVGTDEDIDISLVQYNFSNGEYILMCTDGLTDMVSNDEIINTVYDEENEEDIAKISDSLLLKALDAGGNDNITFILIQV